MGNNLLIIGAGMYGVVAKEIARTHNPGKKPPNINERSEVTTVIKINGEKRREKKVFIGCFFLLTNKENLPPDCLFSFSSLFLASLTVIPFWDELPRTF